MATKKTNIMTFNTIKKIKQKRITIEKVEDYYHIFVKFLKGEDSILRRKEHAWVMGVNEEGYIVCAYIIALGNKNMVDISPHDLFKISLIKDSYSIILAHNHPDRREIKPSDQDILFTTEVYNMAKVINLKLLDHIIISARSLTSDIPVYYSFENSGALFVIEQDNSNTPYKILKPMLDQEKEEYGNDMKKRGLIEGKAEGEKVGLERVVKEMLKVNADIDFISQVTGFSKEEIEKLK